MDETLLIYIAIGFVAQLFDGALGMGFGVISYTVLTALGYPREVVSASVNGAKIFTGAASGAAHMWYRNIDWRLFGLLAAAGAIGGAIGVGLLLLAPGSWIGLLINLYLVLVGVLIIRRAFRPAAPRTLPARNAGIGLAGGVLEALAGVWGPLVTSNLVVAGTSPRYVIGSVSLAETVVAVVVFTLLIGHVGMEQLAGTVVGLAVGAVVAAPIAARFVREVSPRWLMLGVGGLVIATSLFRLARSAGWV